MRNETLISYHRAQVLEACFQALGGRQGLYHVRSPGQRCPRLLTDDNDNFIDGGLFFCAIDDCCDTQLDVLSVL